MEFDKLFINERIKKALVELNYKTLTEVQEKALPIVFDEEDLMCLSQTGSGKTAAFLLPIINNILKEKERFIIRALIVVPTRELALQIQENIQKYGKYTNVRSLAILGGVKESYQKQKINQGLDIVVATPGRLIDLLRQKILNLKHVSYFIIDELDKMLDMGFINDINIINNSLPKYKQNLMFSATINDAIKEISNDILNNPKEVIIKTQKREVSQFVYFIKQDKKLYLLKDIIRKENFNNVVVFCKTKLAAQKTSNFLRGNNVSSDCIHKDKTQIERKEALKKLKDKQIVALVATDILSRGIDIDSLDVVINFDIPKDETTYIHRIGRTGRNNKKGIVINFCSDEEKYFYDKIDVEMIELKHIY